MFKKPFVQKSSSLLKKADRKRLQDRIKSGFDLQDDAVEKILPRKQDVTVTRIQTHQEAEITVYSLEKRAMLFDYYQHGEGNRLVPTVYLLWQHPELVYTFTVHEGVLDYIYTGANLMMPGVVKPKGPTTYFLDKQLASICTVKNKSTVAVGLTAMSGNSTMGGQQGKVLTVLHYYNDHLCYIHDMPILILPIRRSTEDSDQEVLQNVMQDRHWPALGERVQQPQPVQQEKDVVTEVTVAIRALTLNEPGSITEDTKAVQTESPKTATPPPVHITVDAALHRCFMIVAKYSPTLQLPLLTSTFYRKEMVQMMGDQQVDIKSSTYKKVSEFLKAMQKDGLCKLGQKQKGVDTVEEIDYNHESFAAFYLPVESRPKIVEEACAKDSAKLNDTYVVVPEVVDIFLPKFRVGAEVTLSVAKKSVLDYVKKNGLQDIDKEYTLARTAVLQRLCPPGSTRVPNSELMQAVICAMDDGAYKAPCAPSANSSACTSTSSSSQARLPRAVRMRIQTHSGKTVTIVSNLQDYSNVHLATFAKEIQVIAAASAKVEKDTHQIQVQGNQVDLIATLLNKKYGISRSKMMGLELAPKAKKCIKKH